MMDINKIQEYLPHRYPFLLIDRIQEIKTGEKIVAIKNVTINEWFFQGHFPGNPVMPGVLIIEAMAQAGAILILEQMQDAKGKVIYFMTIDSVKFRQPVVPGDVLRLEVTPIKLKGAIAKLHGDAYVGDEKAAEADMMAMLGAGKG
ncbi:MAG: 3-hydroxyacyl-ACP dehydratase FabZ [Candidatus Goldbacteria bacterium]|nr:3-hydroxyacyl-ACP dehydratase FabZ [Candidatus Goldiibacteriota bacterium]HPD18668.1 3-hydroxyacyl-ACP dehydratase FabZ [Candidatus Goldiibacteriota bacterium]